MPLYEYVCHPCRQDFEAIIPAERRDSGDAACPRCGGDQIARKISLTAPVVIKTSGKSGGASVPAFDCGSPGGCCGGSCAMD